MSFQTPITYDEAVKMLPEGETIHTFRANGMLIGADWPRQNILRALKESPEIGLTEGVTLGHGLVCHEGESSLFIETKGETR